MALVMFLTIGTVPGTRTTLPPSSMAALLAALMAITLYWLFRQRPVQQIQEMKRTYHAEIDEPAQRTQLAQKPEHLFSTGFRQSFAQTRNAIQRAQYRLLASFRYWLKHIVRSTNKAARPIQLCVKALAAIVLVATHEIIAWARPHIRRLAVWLHKQAGYSVKGTMLSAHKWSSLSKKLLSSLTSLLRRASSALKRGKSLLIRSAR